MKKLLYLSFSLLGGVFFAQVNTSEINGIKLNMSVAEINAKFHQKISPKIGSTTDEPVNYTPLTISGVQYKIIFVEDFENPQKLVVYSIATTDPKSKGKNAIGIGSTVAELKKAFAKQTVDYDKNRFEVRPKDLGNKILVFTLKNGKVSRIYVSIFAAG